MTTSISDDYSITDKAPAPTTTTTSPGFLPSCIAMIPVIIPPTSDPTLAFAAVAAA
jgi:hypothetical protein